MTIKVLHTADFHIGVENYGRVDRETGLHSRLRDFLASLDQVVDYALTQGVDLVLFAGDAFKNREPSETHQNALARRIRRLSEAGVAVFLLVGNHDLPNASGKAHTLDIYRTLAVPRVTVAGQPGVYRVETRAGVVQVAALPSLSRSALLANQEDLTGKSLEEVEEYQARGLGQLVQGLAQGLEPGLPSLLCAHLSVANAVTGSERAIMLGHDVTLPLSALALPAFDYVALGHIHKHQVLGLEPPVVYSGSLDRVDFGEEGEEKGFVEVTLSSNRTEKAAFRFVPLKTRPFCTLRVTAGEEDPTGDILGALAGKDLSQSILRVMVTLSQEAWGRVRILELKKALEKESYYLAGISREWLSPRSLARNPGLTEGIHPLEAFRAYLEGLDTKVDKEELARGAEALYKELREQELGA